MEELTQHLRWSGRAGCLLTDESFLLEERSSRVQIQRSLLGSLQRDRLSSWDGRLSAGCLVACLGFVEAAATAVTVLGS